MEPEMSVRIQIRKGSRIESENTYVYATETLAVKAAEAACDMAYVSEGVTEVNVCTEWRLASPKPPDQERDSEERGCEHPEEHVERDRRDDKERDPGDDS